MRVRIESTGHSLECIIRQSPPAIVECVPGTPSRNKHAHLRHDLVMQTSMSCDDSQQTKLTTPAAVMRITYTK
jgi:hypothetical protein